MAKIVDLSCPKCKANLHIEEGHEFIYCQYCGTKLYFDDEIKRSEHVDRKIDEARIAEANAKIEQLKYEERQETRNNRSMIIWVILCVSLIVGPEIYLKYTNYAEDKKIEQMKETGKVSLGASYQIIGKPYKQYVIQLEAMGFTDIETIDLNDATIFDKEGTIESITVDGVSSFPSSHYFNITDKVIISYH